MAEHPFDQARSIHGEHSSRNRRCSSYASRIKNFAVDAPVWDNISQTTQGALLQSSPRWNSPGYKPHLPNQSLFLKSSPAVSPATQSPRSVNLGISKIYNRSPSRSIRSTLSLPNMRLQENAPVIENLLRPQKQSLRRTQTIDSYQLAYHRPRQASTLDPTHRHLNHTNALPRVQARQLPWRRLTTRVTSPSTSNFPVLFGKGEVIQSTYYCVRNATDLPFEFAPTTIVTCCPTYPVFEPLVKLDSETSIGLRGYRLGPRTRSQSTVSTPSSKAVTECSSAFTKDSSATSLESLDHNSLMDILSMYEEDFGTEAVDNKSEFDDHGSNGILSSTTITAIWESNNQLVPTDLSALITRPITEDGVVPSRTIACSTLGARSRHSKIMVTNAALDASSAVIDATADLNRPKKLDSVKLFGSKPSKTSYSSSMKDISTAITSIFTRLKIPSPSSTPISAISMPILIPRRPEDPGLRDRYGFKKANQFIDIEQYNAWDAEYSEYVARRRRKWVAYLQDYALITDRPIRFPPPSAKTKKFVRKGIPPEWRGAAWFYYAGGPAILAKHAGLYEKLLQKQAKEVNVEEIERDLYRTFPDNIHFKPSANFESLLNIGRTRRLTITGYSKDESTLGPQPAASNEPPIITSLRRVLHAFSIYNPCVGYCKSLNYLAGLLLLFVETEEQCFWLLNVITIIYLPGTHDVSLEGLKVDLGVLMKELRENLPPIWEKIGGELQHLPTGWPSLSKSTHKPMSHPRGEQPGMPIDRLPPIALCMGAWFMSCYIDTLPIETTLRVWDVFFYDGSKTLFQIALAIVKSGEDKINAVKDPVDMFGVIQAIPRQLLDANALMEACFKPGSGFGRLSQGAIDERRQEIREDISKSNTAG